jgi:tetrahydromethanopterin S-methyltransferase subunit C
MSKMLSRREYIVISASVAVLGLVALTVGLYYLFRYVNSNSLANTVFYAAIWVIGVLVLLRRYSKRRALKSNSS